MTTDTRHENIENQSTTRSDRAENAAREASSGKGDLVDAQKKQTDFLKAGGKSGITETFGKPNLIDTGESGQCSDTPEIEAKGIEPNKFIEQSQAPEHQYSKEADLRITTLQDGTSVSEHHDGTKMIETKDGSTIKVNPDGSIEHEAGKGGSGETMPNGDYHAVSKDGTQTIVKKDGSIIVVEPTGERSEFNNDKSIVHYDRSGNESERVEQYPNGSLVTTKPDGSWSEQKTDGTKIEYNKALDLKTTTTPDGTQIYDGHGGAKVIITPDGGKTVVSPDGSVRSEGGDVDTLPNGDVRTVSKNGTQTIIRQDGSVMVQEQSGHRTIVTNHREVQRFGRNGEAVE